MLSLIAQVWKLIFCRIENNISDFWVIISENKKRNVYHMRLFYFKEKPTTPLRHGGKIIKKHIFQWQTLFIRLSLINTYFSEKLYLQGYFCLSGSYQNIY